MKLSEIKRILIDRKFILDEKESEFIDGEDSYLFYYQKEYCYKTLTIVCDINSDDISEIILSSKEFVYYHEEGICLTEDNLNLNLFKYCLDIQENPSIHYKNFSLSYYNFLKWKVEELDPVVSYLNFKEKLDDSLCVDLANDIGFGLPTLFNYQLKTKNETTIVLTLIIDSLTFNVKANLSEYFIEEDSGEIPIYGLSSGFLLEMLEDRIEELSK